MELGKVSWKRWPWVGFGKMNGNTPGRQGAFHILKSECVTPGVQRKGKDQFLLPCRIAAHDRLSLSGSHNTQLAHGELKPLPFLHCFATSTFIIHASESSFFTKKQKQTLSSFICPSLIADPWFWRLQPCLLRAQCENISILANFLILAHLKIRLDKWDSDPMSTKNRSRKADYFTSFLTVNLRIGFHRDIHTAHRASLG